MASYTDQLASMGIANNAMCSELGILDASDWNSILYDFDLRLFYRTGKPRDINFISISSAR